MDKTPGTSLQTAPADPSADPGDLQVWLAQRRQLVAELTAQLHAGFEAVAAFRAADYLDCVERQEAQAQRLLAHDAAMPDLPAAREARRQAAAALGAMNGELRRLAGIQTALIEIGGRSVRCFQRVWAMAAASYEKPQEGR